MATLNGATIQQGQTKPFTLTLNNPTEDHPLNPDGFNTANYELCLVAKQNLSDADDASTTITIDNARFTAAVDGLTATFSLLPSDTSAIVYGSSNTLTYQYEVWIEDSTQPTVHSYPIESGSFSLKRSVKI